MIFEGDRICGKTFCAICAQECGYEGRTSCPQCCHPESTMKLRRSPWHSVNNKKTDNHGKDDNGSDLQAVVLQFHSPNSNESLEEGEAESEGIKNGQQSGIRSIEVLRCKVLNCKDLCTNESTFFHHLQDQGEPIAATKSRAKNGLWKSMNDDNCQQYKDLKTAADGIIEQMRSHSKYFSS
jgi:hypothetical protein